jgi:RNA polymerase sigma-70 factor (ECF subfamily)
MNRAAHKLVLDAPAVAPPVERTFDVLYDQYFDFVWRSLRRLGVHPALVEDAAQDTFVVVHRRLDDLRPEASAKAWLFGIAMRIASDYRRRQRRKGTVSIDVDSAPASEGSPYESTARAEAARFVERFLNTLDEDKQAVFVLADLEGMSAPEISEALGTKLNTVYSRLRIARERLLEFMRVEGRLS